MSVAKQKRQKELETKRAIRQNRPKAAENHKYLITLAYDGANYGGYAKQKHKNTIQNVLEATLSKYFGTDIKTTEASRTDSKVHALNQKVMFELSQNIATEKARDQLNELLPTELIIKDLQPVGTNFHCRYDVKNKTYEYTISKHLDPRLINYAWVIEKALDVAKMRAASECLVGKHDFSTFKAAKATTDTSVRTVNFIEIDEYDTQILISINADGFLYNMVRLIVKALVDIGTGRQDVNYIQKLLVMDAKPDNLESAPAQGLCLMAINYKEIGTIL